MKNNLVYSDRNEVFTSSKVIAEMLDVKHSDLMRTIENVIDRQKKQSAGQRIVFPQKFVDSSFKNKMGREYKMYVMNEQAYMKLAMKLSGYEKAEQVQDSIIEAFSMMKEALLNHQNASWLSARENGKCIRTEEMDTVRDFVHYATSQGSKSANKYYMNITKMTNKALELLIQSDHGGKVRDMASVHQLGFIQVVDSRAMHSLQWGMNEGLPYKYIYKIAKEEVNTLVDSLDFKREAIKS